MTRSEWISLAAGMVLAVGFTALVSWAVERHETKIGTDAEITAHEAKGEANAHQAQAQAIPSHGAALADTQANVDRARAEVARLKRLLAAKPSLPVPADPPPNQTIETPVHSDSGITDIVSAQDLLIAAQDKQIETLKVALSDEQKRSEEWHQAFLAERRRAQAQEIATEAWKDAVKASRWRGRTEGFLAGVAVGFLGGRR